MHCTASSRLELKVFNLDFHVHNGMNILAMFSDAFGGFSLCENRLQGFSETSECKIEGFLALIAISSTWLYTPTVGKLSFMTQS